jgi:linoleate 10R-lipoxygenase
MTYRASLFIFFQYIADMILKINEQGKWSDPPPEDPVKRATQDEEIFQTARLIK